MSVYFEYPIKCLACSLHFKLYSDHVDWHLKHTVCCPECKTAGMTFNWGPVPIKGFIFESVPGPEYQMLMKEALETLDEA